MREGVGEGNLILKQNHAAQTQSFSTSKEDVINREIMAGGYDGTSKIKIKRKIVFKIFNKKY